jgi:hypothetical protein
LDTALKPDQVSNVGFLKESDSTLLLHSGIRADGLLFEEEHIFLTGTQPRIQENKYRHTCLRKNELMSDIYKTHFCMNIRPLS